LEYPPKPDGAESSELIKVATYSTNQGKGRVKETKVRYLIATGKRFGKKYYIVLLLFR